jgi:hypothetical protein
VRRSFVVTGVILLIIGVVAVVYSTLPQPIVIPQTGSAAVFTVNSIGGATLSVSWSGGASYTNVSVVECGSSDCSSLSGGPLGTASGSSGTLNVPVQGGHTYAVEATGVATNLSGSLRVTGLTPLLLAGAITLVVGVILLVLGFRRAAPKATAARVASPPEELYSAERPTATDAMPAPATPAPTGPGTGRASVQCDHCGTWNEPWITNCRTCKRPLASTSR